MQSHDTSSHEHDAERIVGRRGRARTFALRSLLLGLAVLLIAVLLAYWLLASVRGRDVLLRQIGSRLPEGSELSWARAEGPATGPLILHDARFLHRGCPDQAGKPLAWPNCKTPLITVFTAKRVMLDPALKPLLDKHLRLDALEVSGATLTLPVSDEPFELPRWPESLPQIAPPLAIQADAVQIDDLKILRGDEHLIALHRVQGGISADPGKLHLEHIAADSDRGRFTLHGDYLPREQYRMDLTATAVSPTVTGRTPTTLGLVARGDLRELDVALAGRAPEPVRARLQLHAKSVDDPQPLWQFTGDSAAFSLHRVLGLAEDPPPYAFDLRAEGVGGQATVQGRISQPARDNKAGFALTILPSKVSIENQQLALSPLVIELFDGSIAMTGRADFTDPRTPRFDGDVRARGLQWRGDQALSSITGDGDFKVTGNLQNWRARGQATLLRVRERAVIDVDATGDAASARFDVLRASTPGGRLDGNGQLWWTPALRWQADARLAGFDPGYFLPDWPGAVNGQVRSEGNTRADGGLNVRIDAQGLGGRLRGRALQGRANVLAQLPANGDKPWALRDVRGEGDIALTLGGSRIDAKGRIADTLAVDATLSPLQLNDLLPSGEGIVRGRLQLSGSRAQPDIDADLEGNALRYGDYRAQKLHMRGRLPWRAGVDGALQLDAEGADLGLVFDQLHVDARGAIEALRIDAHGKTEFGNVVLQGDTGQHDGLWRGNLASMLFTPQSGAAWRLQAPTRFAQTRGGWQLSQSCFATTASAGGTLCASADWPTRFDLRGQAVPVVLLEPYLPERDNGRDWRLRGAADVDMQLRPRGNSWQGTLRAASNTGGIALDARSREVLAYSGLSLDAVFDPQRIESRITTRLQPEGSMQARIVTGWDDYAPLSGEIDIDTREITWMELFSPDIVEPKGHLVGRIALGGTRAQPRFGGQALLQDFRTELPALALAVRDGDLRMDAHPDGDARISGKLRSGDGVLQIDGTLGWHRDETPLLLNLRGNNVLISDTRELRAVVDPDVVVRYAVGQPIAVSGTVRVPSAKLDLERLDEGVSTSVDVVVLDPANPQRERDSPLDLDLNLRMGEDVRLHGFGLDGTLTGDVRMRARPGRESIATGTLEVDGRYTAYGQKLQITRGRLVWSNSAFADPIIDIRAQREVGAVTAGIDVRGRAAAPEAQVWSEPASSQSEALSYLALGRPLSTASTDESRQLSAATAALAAGGNLLAAQLGAKIGLDDAGVLESRALGGSVLGVGKYISPRLYVGYGVSLLGTGQVLTLKYLLRKGFDIEIESSTVENRGSVNWRKEK